MPNCEDIIKRYIQEGRLQDADVYALADEAKAMLATLDKSAPDYKQQLSALVDSWASKQEARILGAVTFEADKAIVRLFQGANEATIIHETAHIFRRQLAHFAKDGGPLAKEYAAIEKAFGVVDGVWTREQEEAFANAWLRYLRNSKAPHPALEPAFNLMRQRLLELYADADAAGLPISKEAKRLFDNILSEPFPIAQEKFGRLTQAIMNGEFDDMALPLYGRQGRDANLQGAQSLDANLQGGQGLDANLQGAQSLDANLQGGQGLEAGAQGLECSLQGRQGPDVNLKSGQRLDAGRRSLDANLQGTQGLEAGAQGIHEPSLQGNAAQRLEAGRQAPEGNAVLRDASSSLTGKEGLQDGQSGQLAGKEGNAGLQDAGRQLTSPDLEASPLDIDSLLYFEAEANATIRRLEQSGDTDFAKRFRQEMADADFELTRASEAGELMEELMACTNTLPENPYD